MLGPVGCSGNSRRMMCLEYAAPPVSGGGTVKISLSDEGPFWGAHRHRSRHPAPDALIACNAGLGAYSNWHDVTLASITRDIPFAITDYREISLQINAKIVLKENLMEARHAIWQHIKLTPDQGSEFKAGCKLGTLTKLG